MRAMVLSASERLEIRDIAKPVCGVNDALLKIKSVGICGTDVGIYAGRYEFNPNVILGHEFYAEVLEAGAEVTKVAVGDTVVSEASWGCGRCPACMQAKPSYCANPHMLGRTENGAMAEYIVVPAVILHKIKNDIGSLEAQAAVSVASALRALQRLGDVFQKNVIVIGPGFNGLVLSQILQLAGVRSWGMVGTPRSKDRLVIAERMGASFTAMTTAGYQENIRKEYPHGFDICVEASGSEEALKLAFELVSSGGSILQFGLAHKPFDGLRQYDFYRKELCMLGTKGGYGCYPQAVSLLEKGVVDIASLVSHTYQLEEMPKAFQSILARKENVIRGVLLF